MKRSHNQKSLKIIKSKVEQTQILNNQWLYLELQLSQVPAKRKELIVLNSLVFSQPTQKIKNKTSYVDS